VEALFIIDKTAAHFSQDILDSLVTATYLERNEGTGMLEPKKAAIRRVSALSLSRTFLLIIWFLVPFALTGALLFGGRIVKNHWRKK